MDKIFILIPTLLAITVYIKDMSQFSISDNEITFILINDLNNLDMETLKPYLSDSFIYVIPLHTVSLCGKD